MPSDYELDWAYRVNSPKHLIGMWISRYFGVIEVSDAMHEGLLSSLCLFF